MNLEIFNNLRFEYSLGATVIMFSLIDTSEDRTVLTSQNVDSIIIEYSYDDEVHIFKKDLSFHINSCLMILTGLPENTEISFTPYLIYKVDNIEHKIRITETINETTLPLGNITYKLLSSGSNENDNTVRNKIVNILSYINNLGTHINEDFDAYAPKARTIPIKYNKDIQTANACYYQAYINVNGSNEYGLVQTSGGSYFNNATLFHELRHRYGIYGADFGNLERDQLNGRSDTYSFILDDYSVINDAVRFETGRKDARVWIFDAHSNIPEGEYTDNGDLNYLAANYIKALAWYTSHFIEEEDTSKIRVIVDLSIEEIKNEEEQEVNDEIIDIENDQDNNVVINGVTLNYKQNKIKEKIININNYKYLVRLYKNNINFIDHSINNFVILRNFELYNDIVYDKDIFFIDKNVYNNQESLNNLVFPIIRNSKLNFSLDSSLFTNYEFYNLEDICYDIYNENNELANIKCDHIRIYNPIVKKDLNYIIYIDNYINGIHFHYYCTTNDNMKKYCEDEIIIDNNRFLEYIDVKIPNLENLFNSKYYFIDDYNKIVTSSAKSINEYYSSNDIDNEVGNKMYFKQIIKPYFIKDKSKIFIDNKSFNYNTNYINTSFNITIYPYEKISNNIYIKSDFNGNTIFFNDEYYLRLHSEMGFDNNSISILNTFEFPGKILEKNNYYDVNIHGNYYEENFKDKYINQVTEYYNTYYLYDNIEYLKDQEDYRDELDIENIRTTGYCIQIANDLDFKEIVFESIINTDEQKDNFIFDFSFSLDNIVNSWDQLNEILVIRTKFIDKRLNVVIVGNNVVLTKEWFKYLINNVDIEHIIFNKQNNLINKDFMEVNKGFNFIDKINCIVQENNVNNLNNIDINSKSTNMQIIYKPIFYKVQDLQNIQIRQGVIQNIGVNLGEYMTKVKLFILNIEGNNIKESSRNDIYVIFNVNATILNDFTGIYNILDENFEYISSGNYTIY